MISNLRNLKILKDPYKGGNGTRNQVDQKKEILGKTHMKLIEENSNSDEEIESSKLGEYEKGQVRR